MNRLIGGATHRKEERRLIGLDILLHDGWTMVDGGKRFPCRVPCSVYDTLINAGAIADPYVGENQWAATAVCDRDFAFETSFDAPKQTRPAERLILRFEGIDTLGKVFLNGTLLGETDNMHRVWEYDVTGLVRSEGNLLRVELASPNRYIADMQKKRPIWGVDSTMAGYPHLRKAHYMFGWDWGPMLPDAGIWRPVHLMSFDGGRVRSAYYGQRHENGRVTLTCDADIETWTEGLTALFRVTAPDGEQFEALIQDGKAEIIIQQPQLWWVRGLGEQPLYTCETVLINQDETVDTFTRRVGLRTLTVSQDKDEWGEEFCFINNGVKVFAMGANYIPEDQILPRATKERSRQLLEDCKAANYNFIRVWGGGIYPDDDFYDWCDENGLIVWQDCMFACSAYRLTPALEKTIRAEIIDNVLSLRNHASLGLICGNNEIESAWEAWGIPDDPEAKADYLKLFEGIIPETVHTLSPETFYWPSSPSSGGGFKDSSSNRAGDMHYWAVWHNFKPIEAFREFYYRFCSEYGFESLPDIKTVRTFAEEKDLELCSHVMEAHQKCTQGNEKVMYYLAQMVNYPYDFERLIYCSQLVQADCIRSNVEHMRRARGRCMGSAYWQVNDSNPVISWSSIDYFGRWKGLHYAARRFYAPVLLSCDDTDPIRPVLHVTNDTREEVHAELICRLRDNQANVLREFSAKVSVPALTAMECLKLDLSADVVTMQDKRTKYIEYALVQNGQILSAGTTLFVRPKGFDFIVPQVDCGISETDDAFILRFTASCYTKSVCLSLREHDAVFSDNWFDIHGNQAVTVTLPRKGTLSHISAEELRAQLKIAHY